MLNHVKITTLPNLLDLLAPYSCRGCGRTGKPLCDCCKNYIIKTCCHVRPKSRKHSRHFFALAQRESLIGKLIYDLKFNSSRALAQTLAEILHHALPKSTNDTVIVPLPTNTKHIRTRGLDHTYLIAKKLAKLRGQNYRVQKILTRQQNTIQVGANKTMRDLQAQQAYQLNQKVKINPNATYLLLDDIITTGSSIKAATKKLQQAGVKKPIVVVLAVS